MLYRNETVPFAVVPSNSSTDSSLSDMSPDMADQHPSKLCQPGWYTVGEPLCAVTEVPPSPQVSLR